MASGTDFSPVNIGLQNSCVASDAGNWPCEAREIGGIGPDSLVCTCGRLTREATRQIWAFFRTLLNIMAVIGRTDFLIRKPRK